MGRFRVFAGGYAALVVLYAVLILAPATLPTLFVSLLLLSLYYATTEGVLMALASVVVPDTFRTTGFAVLTTATAVARLGASLIFGLAWFRLGLKPAVSMFLLGLLIAVGLAVVTVPRAPQAPTLGR
jgi:hypothetical protein